MNNDLISRKALKDKIQEIVETEMPIDEKWAMGLRHSLKLIDNAPAVEERPRFNRGELEKALNYWYEHFEHNNKEQNEAAWCAINTIRYCIENSSAYQE